MYRRIVQLVVNDSSSPILNAILDSGNDENDDDGNRCEARVINPKDGKDLPNVSEAQDVCIALGTYSEDDNEYEVDIGNVVKLEPKILRDEADGCILGRSDLVPGILGERMSLLVASALW